MLRRLGVLVTAALLLAPVPSYADSWSAADPVGDATTYEFSPEPEPCGTVTQKATPEGDIRRLSVRHTRDRIVLTLQVTGLTKAFRTAAVFDVLTPDREWNIDVDRYHQKTEVSYYEARQFDADDVGECGYYAYGVAPRSCRGATAAIEVAGDRITASVPRRCLGNPRWVQVGAQVYGGRGARSFSDLWVPVHDDNDVTTPAVGRRVFGGPRR